MNFSGGILLPILHPVPFGTDSSSLPPSPKPPLRTPSLYFPLNVPLPTHNSRIQELLCQLIGVDQGIMERKEKEWNKVCIHWWWENWSVVNQSMVCNFWKEICEKLLEEWKWQKQIGCAWYERKIVGNDQLRILVQLSTFTRIYNLLHCTNVCEFSNADILYITPTLPFVKKPSTFFLVTVFYILNIHLLMLFGHWFILKV